MATTDKPARGAGDATSRNYFGQKLPIITVCEAYHEEVTRK